MSKEENQKKAMLMFLPCFEIFWDYDNRPNPKGSYWIGKVVLLAFTCEIGLKSLAVSEGKDFPHKHKLNELFTPLSRVTKCKIIAKSGYEKDIFIKLITENNDHFEKWRYYFEDCSPVNFDFLNMLLSSIVETLLPPEYLKQRFPLTK